jgi:hypothetical protein
VAGKPIASEISHLIFDELRHAYASQCKARVKKPMLIKRITDKI